MVTHIVMFKLTDPSPENLATTHEKLLSMQGKIAELRHLEAGVDVIRSERSYDIALVTASTPWPTCRHIRCTLTMPAKWCRT